MDQKALSGGKIRRYDGAGSSERRDTLDSEGIETWCSSSTGPSTRSCGTCRRRDTRSTGPGARRHGLHPGRPRGRRVSKRTGKVRRNGRTRSTGRNERPLSDRCRGDMDERIAIAGMHRAGSGVRAIARTHSGAPSTNENTNGLPRQYSPQGNRPVRIHRGMPRRSRYGTQRQTPQDPGLHETQREDPRTDRRHRNINTNRHHQHQLSTKMLRRPLEFVLPPHRLRSGRRSPHTGQ